MEIIKLILKAKAPTIPPRKIQHLTRITTRQVKFPITDFFSKYDQIHSFLGIWSHLLNKSLMENIIFCALNKNNWYYRFNNTGILDLIIDL